jgi:hypothetical protein
MSTIPADQIVKINPSVLEAGGRALDIIAIMLTNSDRVPVGAVQPFASAQDVMNYFGPSSTEGSLATVYFNGFDGSNIKPAQVYLAQYPAAAVPAWLRSGPVSGYTIAQLQALAVGTIPLTINGAAVVAPAVDLSTVTSFSNAAATIQAGFTATQATATSNTISDTTLTLGGTITGNWAPGQTVVGVGVAADTHILALLSGTPNTDGATYSLDKTNTVGSGVAMTGAVIPQVTYDSVSGAFLFKTILKDASQSIGYAGASDLSTALKLTSATGAVISPGALAPTDPGAFMDGVVDVTTDWATFMTCFDPDTAGENTNKLAFTAWTNAQNNRYAYVCWDTDEAPATQSPATQSLGYLLQQSNATGTFLIGQDTAMDVSPSHAAFACGVAASLDFSEFNGRADFAFRRQTGLLATCTSASAANNLIANGYNFYGVYATANDQNIFMNPGSVSGPFLWMDSYIDQIWLNNQFQLAFIQLLLNVKSIPYNAAGYSLIQAAALDVINQAVNFGVIRAGVTLSQAQAANVNNAAGVKISDTLNQRGWYFQVLDASPQVRQARGSPPCTFWYMDGGSVQKITLASIELV